MVHPSNCITWRPQQENDEFEANVAYTEGWVGVYLEWNSKCIYVWNLSDHSSVYQHFEQLPVGYCWLEYGLKALASFRDSTHCGDPQVPTLVRIYEGLWCLRKCKQLGISVASEKNLNKMNCHPGSEAHTAQLGRNCLTAVIATGNLGCCVSAWFDRTLTETPIGGGFCLGQSSVSVTVLLL